MMQKGKDLEDRLINHSVLILEIAESLPASVTIGWIANQLARSGTSSALNYGEARGAESRKDFIHKMKVCLKELRETLICLKIIDRKAYASPSVQLENALKENDELISIFVASIKTAIQSEQRKNL